jgi:FKBP-type peptidyl-prolyl cis-trans isomerase FkpA
MRRPRPAPFQRLAALSLTLPLAVAFAACSDSGTNPALPFDEVVWAPALGIDPADFTELSTGVWIRDDQGGSGAEAANGSRVRTHYRGFVPDGTRFDSSLDPAPRDPLDWVIGAGTLVRGFELGTRGMRAGGVRTVLIPPFLGYGSRPPAGSAIPPNAWLIFEIHLLEIVG